MNKIPTQKMMEENIMPGGNVSMNKNTHGRLEQLGRTLTGTSKTHDNAGGKKPTIDVAKKLKKVLMKKGMI
jgi:hypothetical protein